MSDAKITDILTELVAKKVSYVFLVSCRPLAYKLNEEIMNYDDTPLKPDDTSRLIARSIRLQSAMKHLYPTGDRLCLSIRDVSRFRASMYKQLGCLRGDTVIAFKLPPRPSRTYQNR